MVKIAILGGPGSGKTTLAQNLSALLHVPNHDLDTIGWTHGDDIMAHIKEAAAIANQPTWIAEGVHIIWTEPLFHHADYIVLLDISWPVAAWRVIRRHIVKSLRGTNPYPGMKSLWNFLKFTRGYYTDRISADATVAEAVRVYLLEHEGDIELPSAERLSVRLETGREAIPLTADFIRRYLEKYKKKVVIIKNNLNQKQFIEEVARHRV